MRRCDPSTLRTVAAAAVDSTWLLKTYYTDQTFSREQTNSEGPQRGVPRVACGTDGRCQRHEHVGATKGDTVLKLRTAKKDRACLPALAEGACIDPNYTPPPKKKKPPPPPPPPPPEEPPLPREPGAPPPPPL